MPNKLSKTKTGKTFINHGGRTKNGVLPTRSHKGGQGSPVLKTRADEGLKKF